MIAWPPSQLAPPEATLWATTLDWRSVWRSPAIHWRPGYAWPRLWLHGRRARIVEGFQSSPNLIPEGEQRLRRSRTRDEREPSGFPLISRSWGRSEVRRGQENRYSG